MKQPEAKSEFSLTFPMMYDIYGRVRREVAGDDAQDSFFFSTSHKYRITLSSKVMGVLEVSW